MRDYARLCKALRHCATHFSCSGCGGDCKTGSNEPRAKAVLNEAADAIEELLAAAPNWISVEERLPAAEDGDPWDRCLAYSDEDQLMTLPLCKVGSGYATHWMRIEPPQTEREP